METHPHVENGSPFAQLRLTRFNGLAATVKADLEYLEQLASQTQTNIDEWVPYSVLEGIKFGDKRGINKAFFKKIETQQKTAASLSDIQKKLLEEAAQEMDRAKIKRIMELDRKHREQLKYAQSYMRDGNNALSQAWQYQKERLILEERTPDFLTQDLKKILQGSFWELFGYEKTFLRLTSRQDIVLKEVNPAGNVNRHVNMGRYLTTLNLANMTLTVGPFKNNLCSNGHYHPYLASDGEVCWGNASDSAMKLLASCQLVEVFQLLASLLSNYGSDTNPYIRLANFDVLQKENKRVAEPNLNRLNRLNYSGQWCVDCDEPRMECACEDWCSICDTHTDDCECYYCETCEENYRDRCEEHWCSVCETYEKTTCDCCYSCDETSGNCARCRECDTHPIRGILQHSPNCSIHRRNQTETSDIPF